MDLPGVSQKPGSLGSSLTRFQHQWQATGGRLEDSRLGSAAAKRPQLGHERPPKPTISQRPALGASLALTMLQSQTTNRFVPSSYRFLFHAVSRVKHFLGACFEDSLLREYLQVSRQKNHEEGHHHHCLGIASLFLAASANSNRAILVRLHLCCTSLVIY